jgi:hypothetical protein
VSATAFKAMTASPLPGERDENETSKGLRVSDRGFLNTAVMRSEITYIDGEAGGMLLGFAVDIARSKTQLYSSQIQGISHRAARFKLLSPRDRLVVFRICSTKRLTLFDSIPSHVRLPAIHLSI